MRQEIFRSLKSQGEVEEEEEEGVGSAWNVKS